MFDSGNVSQNISQINANNIFCKAVLQSKVKSERKVSRRSAEKLELDFDFRRRWLGW